MIQSLTWYKNCIVFNVTKGLQLKVFAGQHVLCLNKGSLQHSSFHNKVNIFLTTKIIVYFWTDCSLRWLSTMPLSELAHKIRNSFRNEEPNCNILQNRKTVQCHFQFFLFKKNRMKSEERQREIYFVSKADELSLQTNDITVNTIVIQNTLF